MICNDITEADHAIDIPDSEADQFISMKKWFAKYV